jgi:hypothetical protein
MYIEASQPRSTGEVAVLQSPKLPAGQDYCFQLATNMYGDTMGSIDVDIEVHVHLLIKTNGLISVLGPQV